MEPILKPVFKPLLALVFGLALGCSSSASPTDAAGDGNGGRAGAGADATGSGGTTPGAGGGSGGASPTGSGGSGGKVDGGDAASDMVSGDADATGSGGAGGRDGGSGDAADLKCMEVALLRLSQLTVNATAAAGGTAELQVTVANTTDRFISYAGAALECDEMGTLVIDASTNWLFGISAGEKANYVYRVRIAASAPSGATIRCTARAATITAQQCPEAETLRTEFKVK